MARAPSGGWREVYRWCGVALPMTPRETPRSRQRPAEGVRTMSDRHNQAERNETERFAKKKLREIARDLESAQGAATVEQLVKEIEAAGAELAHVKTEIEEQIES